MCEYSVCSEQIYVPRKHTKLSALLEKTGQLIWGKKKFDSVTKKKEVTRP